MKTIKIWLITSMMLLLVGITAANPGIVMEVTPIDNEVLPGETATYEVNVSYFMDDPQTEHVVLSIDNPLWSYTFDPAEFDINTSESKYSTARNLQPYCQCNCNWSNWSYYHHRRGYHRGRNHSNT